MRPFHLLVIVVLGLAAVAAAVFLAGPRLAVTGPGEGRHASKALSFHPQTPEWIVAQTLKRGAKAVRYRVRVSDDWRNMRLGLLIYDGHGRLRHRVPLENRGNGRWAAWDGTTGEGDPLPAGRYELELIADSEGAAPVRSERRQLTILNVDLDVDADRNGRVTEEDEDGEDDVTARSGAYFAVNFDADGGRKARNSRVLADTMIFDDTTGHPTHLNDRIENEADARGLAPLVVRGLGARLPPGLRVFLRAGEREDIESVQIYAERAAGARKIWGGLGSREGREPVPMEIDITRFVDPASADFSGERSNADLTFAVEGLFFRNDPSDTRKELFPAPLMVNTFDGDIDLYLEIRHKDNLGKLLFSDHVRMRVVPWLIFPPTQPSLAVYARDAREENEVLLTRAEEGYFDLSATKQLIVVPNTAKSEEIDDLRWFQDHAVLGGYHLPGTDGAERTYAALRLPYEVDGELSQPGWVADYFVGSDRGVFQFGSWLGNDHGSEDHVNGGHGGNIEAVPPSATYPLGRIVIGDTMPGGLRVFLKSQRVQPPLTLPTRWLAVGHIDEMIGFTGQGGETLIADPVLAYRLLEAIPEEERGAAVFFAKGGSPVAGTVRTTPEGSRIRAGRRLDTGIDHRGSGMRYVRIYRDKGSGAAGQVAHIAPGGLRDGYVIIDRVWDTATRALPSRRHELSVLQFVGIDEKNGDSVPDELTVWDRIPEPGDKFVMVPDTKFWIEDAPAVITVEELLADSKLRRLNSQHIASRLSSVRRRLQREGGRNSDGTPLVTFKSVPVLFVGRPGKGFVTGRTAAGLTPNLANFQPVGEHLYMPRQFGPLNGNGQDIFETFVRETLGERVRFVDTWDAYHRQFGEVHCATNVLRQPFDFDWWTRIPSHAAP